MGLDSTVRRRIVGGLMLAAALIMLIAGQTFLKSRLQDFGFLIYWSVCLIFTGMAIVVAWVDARSMHQRGRREARDLLESTLDEIQRDAKQKPSPSARRNK
ncbi:MAG TPA: phage holin family protein [Verrucomicrobiae bacterium]|jgi:hypothetical protein|nr:phage holin family protein [Verrucomicrobiae bacterium]